MKRHFLIYLILVCSGKIFAIVPPLEREVTITVVNERVSNVLNKIQDQTGLIFSYQPVIVDGLPPVSLHLKHRSVREALALILPKNIIYKSKNKYIILKEKPVEKDPKKTEISGYVYDKTTEQKVANVTIYDKQSLQSVTTDEYGYYSISVPSSNEKISINKENYKDTSLTLSDIKDTKIINISLNPVTDSAGQTDSTDWKSRLKDLNEYTHQIFKKFKGYVNTLNIKDTLTRNVQVSIFPYIGTNHKLSGNVINKLSFNVYGGYARGVNGFEIGGLFNIDEENVRGVQLAGLLNIVGDTLRGTQFAGLFNITGKSSNGFQAAGMMNINDGKHKGFQAAGLMNINDKIMGTGVAGMMNISGSVKGVQMACLANINDTLSGLAVAGMFNVNKHGKGATQLAGMFNVSDHGSANVQVAGLFNSAAYLKGVQIAPFNFSDSASGVPIGFLSFVKKGVHQIELGVDELFSLNLSLRTGVNSFYNIFSAGMQPGGLWHVGYGAGTSFKIKNKWRSDLTATFHHVSNGGFYFATSDLYRVYWGVEYKFKSKFSFAAGPMLNIYVSDTYEEDYTTIYAKVPPFYASSSTSVYGFNTRVWAGARIALRFL